MGTTFDIGMGAVFLLSSGAAYVSGDTLVRIASALISVKNSVVEVGLNANEFDVFQLFLDSVQSLIAGIQRLR